MISIRVNRWPASVRIEGCQLAVHPAQIEQAVDLPHQMIRRHHLVEIKRIKELALTALLPPQHSLPPQMPSQLNGITVRESSQPEFCNTIDDRADIELHWPEVRYSP